MCARDGCKPMAMAETRCEQGRGKGRDSGRGRHAGARQAGLRRDLGVAGRGVPSCGRELRQGGDHLRRGGRVRLVQACAVAVRRDQRVLPDPSRRNHERGDENRDAAGGCPQGCPSLRPTESDPAPGQAADGHGRRRCINR